MMLLALRALVARIPGIAFVIAGALLALSLAGWSLYRRGEGAGARTVAAVARADTTARAIAAVDSAAARADRIRAVAAKARVVSDSGRARLAITRAKVAAALEAPPEIRIAALTEHVDSLEHQVARDAVTIATFGAFADSAAAERLAHAQLDTARVHEREDPPLEASGGHGRTVAIGVGVATAVVWLLHPHR